MGSFRLWVRAGSVWATLCAISALSGSAYGQTLDSYSRDRSNCDLGNSPQPAQVFVDPMPIPPELPARPLSDPGLLFGASA